MEKQTNYGRGIRIFETPSDAQSPKSGLFELISGSPESYCELWRTDKDGRFRVYKALKGKYSGDPVYERLLRKEFEIGYSLRHPNICEYYGFVNIQPLGNCIEMEWIDGCSLDNLLPRGAIGKTMAVKIINEICDALAYMHSKQVVHRDLKPSNIMLTYNGNNVKLIDFGLSDSDSHSVLKGSAGTRVYASPELISGGTVDFRSDIFSLGCIIDRLSPSFAKVAAKCCHRDPEKRFQSALEVKQAIAHKSKSSLIITAAAIAALGGAIVVSQPLSHTKGTPEASAIQTDTAIFTDTKDTVHTDEPMAAQQVPPAPTQETSSATRKHTKSSAQPNKPRSKGNEAEVNNNQEAIDELFRQATELFDQ